MNSNNYTKLLNDNITADYKKPNDSQMNDINKKAVARKKSIIKNMKEMLLMQLAKHILK